MARITKKQAELNDYMEKTNKLLTLIHERNLISANGVLNILEKEDPELYEYAKQRKVYSFLITYTNSKKFSEIEKRKADKVK